jgi:hypothetical protein
MNADLQHAVSGFAHDNEIVMLVVDPRHPDAMDVASFLWEDPADEFLNAETIKAVATKELDRLFVLVGTPFQQLMMTRAGKATEAKSWLSSMTEWAERRKLSLAILAIVQPELKEPIGAIIDQSSKADRFAKFLI